MSNYLELKRFEQLNLYDPFFDTLKSDYSEFEEWFKKKSEKEAYVLYDEEFIQGFLYLKMEEGPILDVEPILEKKRILKVGTLKIDPHGTRLGEHFIKKALDHAIIYKAEACYVTIFERHKSLLELLLKYGFYKHGVKQSSNGEELVLVKDMVSTGDDTLKDYPIINTRSAKKFMLAIYPDYHTNMFPDSILKNESFDILEDVSHTNSIHKIYVTGMPVYQAERGDIIVIYRTNDHKGHAEYRSVATSICVVEEVNSKNDFTDFDDYYSYANTYSIFDRKTLLQWYNKSRSYTIKMTYNAALTKKLTRKLLAEEVGLNRGERWSFKELSNEQFGKILELGEINEGIVVD